ncbi:hypothetical protein KP79_PYT05752 [Mizuhopecten yessoensis]|uniref:Uncharacterized protein n=1 Tax=Mizuhopecten yessoensis TaxID=6573 RepID=A0A210QYB0_MIZYE|nr:hypothetical protein KP79_PYT05752 [Mizuhopecten yessoensis]
MNSQLLIRCFQSPQQCVNNIIRKNTRCVHKCVVHYQEASKEPPSMPEYLKKRQKLLESNPVKYSAGKAKKWDLKKKGIVSREDEKPFHRHVSAILSISVLFIYLFVREENGLDEKISFDPKTAEEYQAVLDKLKKNK